MTAPGFDTKIYSGEVRAGQTVVVPVITLTITTVTASVDVELTPLKVAEEQLQEEVHQRVFGIIPNFYVSYEANAAPLVPRQKFKLAFKSVTDPITIVGAGAIAGIYQAADEFPAMARAPRDMASAWVRLTLTSGRHLRRQRSASRAIPSGSALLLQGDRHHQVSASMPSVTQSCAGAITARGR